MERDNKIVLGALLILFLSMVSFNSNLTGLVSHDNELISIRSECFSDFALGRGGSITLNNVNLDKYNQLGKNEPIKVKPNEEITGEIKFLCRGNNIITKTGRPLFSYYYAPRFPNPGDAVKESQEKYNINTLTDTSSSTSLTDLKTINFKIKSPSNTGKYQFRISAYADKVRGKGTGYPINLDVEETNQQPTTTTTTNQPTGTSTGTTRDVIGSIEIVKGPNLPTYTRSFNSKESDNKATATVLNLPLSKIGTGTDKNTILIKINNNWKVTQAKLFRVSRVDDTLLNLNLECTVPYQCQLVVPNTEIYSQTQYKLEMNFEKLTTTTQPTSETATSTTVPMVVKTFRGDVSPLAVQPTYTQNLNTIITSNPDRAMGTLSLNLLQNNKHTFMITAPENWIISNVAIYRHYLTNEPLLRTITKQCSPYNSCQVILLSNQVESSSSSYNKYELKVELVKFTGTTQPTTIQPTVAVNQQLPSTKFKLEAFKYEGSGKNMNPIYSSVPTKVIEINPDQTISGEITVPIGSNYKYVLTVSSGWSLDRFYLRERPLGANAYQIFGGRCSGTRCEYVGPGGTRFIDANARRV